MKFDIETATASWEPPADWQKIKTVDMHTGGEPLRVIVGGLPELKAKDVLSMRRYFMSKLDHIRKALIFEPRGHADMYACIIAPPCSSNADFSTFFPAQ